jgi:hypothetical protein
VTYQVGPAAKASSLARDGLEQIRNIKVEGFGQLLNVVDRYIAL